MQEKLFLLLDALETLTFGLGTAFSLFAWPAAGRMAGSSNGKALDMCFGTPSLLSYWAIPDNLHPVVGLRPIGLRGIEY